MTSGPSAGQRESKTPIMTFPRVLGIQESRLLKALTSKSSGKKAGNTLVSICPIPTAILFANVLHGSGCPSCMGRGTCRTRGVRFAEHSNSIIKQLRLLRSRVNTVHFFVSRLDHALLTGSADRPNARVKNGQQQSVGRSGAGGFQSRSTRESQSSQLTLNSSSKFSFFAPATGAPFTCGGAKEGKRSPRRSHKAANIT